MSLKTNIIFQIKDLNELKLVFKDLSSDNYSYISNLDCGYYISCDDSENIIELVKQNKTNINELFFDYAILRTFDNGVAPSSEIRIFKFNYQKERYEPQLIDNIELDFKGLIKSNEYILIKN